MFAQECQNIRAAMRVQLPALWLPDKISKPLGQGTLDTDSLDLEALVKIQFQHQTRHAALAVRTRSSHSITPEGMKRQKEESIRRQLIKEFHAVIKEQQAQGAGTGAKRVVRWRPGDASTQPESSHNPLATGNAANAALAANQVATKVV
jgi:hypothetical protein